MKKITPFLILLLFLVSCGGGNNDNSTKKTSKKCAEPKFLYGICIDSLDVVEGKVQKNEFLANILQREAIIFGFFFLFSF